MEMRAAVENLTSVEEENGLDLGEEDEGRCEWDVFHPDSHSELHEQCRGFLVKLAPPELELIVPRTTLFVWIPFS